MKEGLEVADEATDVKMKENVGTGAHRKAESQKCAAKTTREMALKHH